LTHGTDEHTFNLGGGGEGKRNRYNIYEKCAALTSVENMEFVANSFLLKKKSNILSITYCTLCTQLFFFLLRATS
jgi:hypothetical protein